MRLIILGAPGAGKGTQAEMLSGKYNVPHISTGDIFRNNIESATTLGVKVKEYIDKGMLVPDEITIEIVKQRIMDSDCEKGFILDGFPRTIPQAEYLDEALENMDMEPDAVLNLYVSDEDIIKRLTGRRICPSCGKSYHYIYNPPDPSNLCEDCRVELIQREDDKEETVRERLKTYHKQTEPLIKYYEKQDKLVTAVGQEDIKDTTKEVEKALYTIE